MQPTLAPVPKPQQRLRRFIRQPEKLGNRQITDKGLDVLATVERYRFLPSSLLVRLVDGGERNNYRHLQTLFHRGLVNRFALPKYGGPGEFIYYLDSTQPLTMIIQDGRLPQLTEGERRRKDEVIRYNRESDYAQLHRKPDSQGKVLYIQHELMVSRFHAILELACKKLAGKVALEHWNQGSELWSRVELPKVRPHHRDELTGRMAWEELDTLEHLPHRPDAFFTFYFPTTQQRSHFLYEADRETENTTRYKMKLRAHYHFVVKQNRHRTAPYNVHSIRAVLTESTSSQWAHNLREAAKENVVSPKPSPLFWFTTSELLTKPQTITTTGRPRQVPLYLLQPEAVFKRIWASPADDKLLNLAD